jgi:hypothetical protein
VGFGSVEEKWNCGDVANVRLNSFAVLRTAAKYWGSGPILALKRLEHPRERATFCATDATPCRPRIYEHLRKK